LAAGLDKARWVIEVGFLGSESKLIVLTTPSVICGVTL
jgi:hypothetical protein